MNLGYAIYNGIESNEYLNELYENILYNYSRKIFELSTLPAKEVNIDDALQFADILSKSTHPNPNVADSHKIWGQEIVALLNFLEPQNPIVQHYLGAVLSSTGNYRGMFIKAHNYRSGSIFDRTYDEFSKDILSVPSNPEKHFFRSQLQAYKRFDDPYFSFSGPTSMGKSFVMQSFIKEQVQTGNAANFAIIVPTKALINEVFSSIIADLKELLKEKDYRVVTSAGALALEQPHNFIFVLTPERLLYLLIRHKQIDIDYLFVDEAHKISAPRDSRSAFYYKSIDMLLEREKKPHIIFASPNIPNPEVYLGLIPDADKSNNHKLSTAYSPVTQIKYLLDTIEGGIQVYNEHTQNFVPIAPSCHDTLNETLRIFFENNSSSIVYYNSRDEAMRAAQDFAENLPPISDPETGMPDKDLEALSKDIRNLVHKQYYLADVVTKGVAYHVGYLPPSIRMRIEELFRDQKIKIMFCTSTLLEGVNLPADNLFITNYYKGPRLFTPVDFRNLVGRVGRIKYNLYGNVFLTRLKMTIKTEKFIEYLQRDVPEQKLSIANDLKPRHKALIVNCLSQGVLEIPKDGLNENEYPIVRKFALILLRDILRNRHSTVYKAFKELLTNEIIAKIKSSFANSENQPDDDINTSIDQTNSLVKAIDDGLEYPKIDDATGMADYKDVLAFLQRLHAIFKWGIYEKKVGIGHPNSLTWYATLLCQWVSGSGLNRIMDSAIGNANNRRGTDNPKTVRLYGKDYAYDDSPLHRNLVISEALQAIESVILFSFSNYFIKFTECYKKRKGVNPPYDWCEFVEYGTSNPLSIMLQRNGFSRETALYIKENKDTYVIIKNGVAKLRRAIAIECPKESVRAEVADIIYNAPDLFID